MTQLERERALILYLVALENGNDNVIERTLELAQNDLELEEMIFEQHDYEAEQNGFCSVASQNV